MTPRLPPSRLLLLATPSHDPLSRSPLHLPLLSLCLSLGVLLVVFPPPLTFPLRPRVPHSLLLLPHPLARPFLFAYSLSLSRLRFLSRTAKENARRDAEFRDSRPRCSVCIRERSNRAPGSDFLPTAWTTFRYVLFLFFSLSLALSVCLPLRAPETLRVFLQRASRTRAYAPSLQLGGGRASLLQLAYARLVFLSRLLSLFLATLAFVIFRYWVSRTVNCQLSATVVVPPVQNAQMRARACMHVCLSLSLSSVLSLALFFLLYRSVCVFSLGLSPPFLSLLPATLGH